MRRFYVVCVFSIVCACATTTYPLEKIAIYRSGEVITQGLPGSEKIKDIPANELGHVTYLLLRGQSLCMALAEVKDSSNSAKKTTKAVQALESLFREQQEAARLRKYDLVCCGDESCVDEPAKGRAPSPPPAITGVAPPGSGGPNAAP